MRNILKLQNEIKKNQRKGFTLVELIVVIAIIAILAALLVPKLTKYLEDANDSRGFANARQIYTAGAALGASMLTKGKDPDFLDNVFTTVEGVDDKDTLLHYLGSNFTGYGEAELSSTDAVISATWWTKKGSHSGGSGDSYTYPDMKKNGK